MNDFLIVWCLRYKPLNVITLEQIKSDDIKRMMTVTNEIYLLIFSKWDLEMWSH